MEIKSLSFNEIEKHSKELSNLSDYLFVNPEILFQEHKAHDYICNFLDKKRFKVERNFIYNTGFRATYETNATPHFAILVEYDALPEIGHACGHNIIAQSSVATAIGLKVAMDNGLKCKLSVLGTPAEEGGGGKIKFITEGIFNDIDIAIMSHPFKQNIAKLTSMALTGLTISFMGKATHASLSPAQGVNALDAAVLAYQAISCLRQQMSSDHQIHGIISRGGDSANVIPDFTEMKYFIRAPTSKHLKEFLPRVHACFNGAANATRCEMSLKETTPIYEEIRTNIVFADIFEMNAKELGISFTVAGTDFHGSSDVGNVSQVCPTIQPMFFIGSQSELHTKEFALCAGTKEAKEFGILQAKAMCGTLIDILLDEKGQILKEIKSEFQKKNPNYMLL